MLLKKKNKKSETIVPANTLTNDWIESYQDGYNYACKTLREQFNEEKQQIAERIMFILSPIQFWDDTAYTLKIRNLYEYLVNELGYNEENVNKF